MTARVSFVGRVMRLGVAVGWIVLFVAVGVAASFAPVRFAPAAGDSPWRLAEQSAGLMLGFGLATWLVGVRLAKLSWTELGWKTDGGLLPRVARGVLLGVLMAALAVGLSLAGSGARLDFRADWSRSLALGAPLILTLWCAALFEELVFRGFPLRRLASALGPGAATGVLAALFGVAHLRNPNASLFSTLNIALAAVFLAVAFFSSGGMGLAWGLHFGWNAGLGVLFDAPVSGFQMSVPPVTYVPGARPWVDGGAFGPEGGLVGTIAFVAAMAVLLGKRLPRPGEWLA